MKLFPVRSRVRTACLAAAAFALAAPAAAHVVLEYPVASAGSSYRATFKLGHGCAGSPTRQVVVEIPPGVRGARPMPKPGWSLEVVRAKLAQPYERHGRTVSEDVALVRWTAKTPEDMLPDAHYDEFVLSAQMPAQAGVLHWPVRQLCEQGRNDWVEVPRPGPSPAEPKFPAVMLEIIPAGGAGGHKH